MELPPLPEPEPQPPLSDGDFERLNETALHAMRDHIAMGLSPLFSVQAPSHIDLARYSTVPVVLMRRIDEHRLWDVEPQLNVLLAITDLTTDRVSFEFPYAVDKPILPSGRSRFGKPPAPPYNASFAFVDLRILHPDFSVPGGRGQAITAPCRNGDHQLMDASRGEKSQQQRRAGAEQPLDGVVKQGVRQFMKGDIPATAPELRQRNRKKG